MNSDTIGIPRFGPGGYYLTNVLFTQYFTGDGASIHYNYWSSNWGYAGSHGCLGLTLRRQLVPVGLGGLGHAGLDPLLSRESMSPAPETRRVPASARLPSRLPWTTPDCARSVTSRLDLGTTRASAIGPEHSPHPWN